MRKVLASILLAAACYAPSGEGTGVATTYGEVTVTPPDPIVETPPPAPYPDALWSGGYWDWEPAQRHYVWIGGRWIRAPRPGVVIMPPRWERGRWGWRRTPGRFVPGVTQDRLGRQVWFDSLGRPHYF